MILSVDIARKTYPTQKGQDDLVVLQDLRFALDAREILAIFGPSGCGKTTLLKIIGGLDKHFQGRVEHANDARIGTVFQEPRLLPWRTVYENIALVKPDRVTDTIEELLHVMGLWPFRDAFPAQLSLGMARRAAIARAFAIAPDIVLLDEPFVSLDRAMADRSRSVLLTAWSRSPISAILVTHDLRDAAALADRIVMLSTSPARILADIPVPDTIRRIGGDTALKYADELQKIAASLTATRDDAARIA